MNQNRYIRKIASHLKCSAKTKKQIIADLRSDINLSCAQGESLEQVMKRMGSAEEVATEFNENFSDKEKKAAKKRKIVKIVSIVLLIIAALILAIVIFIPKSSSIEESKVFTKDKVEDQLNQIITAYSTDDYHTLFEFSTDKFKTGISEDKLSDAKKKVGIEGKKEYTVSSTYMTEIEQLWQKYALIEANVTYGDKSVIFTISLDQNMKLAGFYIR